MRRSPMFAALAFTASLLGATEIAAQPRGVELFGAMLSQPLVRTTGTTSVRWLPNGMGYLERDSTADGPVFHRVDPESGRRSPLFERRSVAALVAEYARITGSRPKGLPFTDFEFQLQGKAITFAVGADRFLFDLEARTLRKLLMPEAVGPLDEATTDAGRFSPDLNYYAFIRDYDHLYLFDTRTGAQERLVEGTGENNLVGFLGAGPWFVWSPDSRRIAYLTADQRGLSRYPILHDLDRHATTSSSGFRSPPIPTRCSACTSWTLDQRRTFPSPSAPPRSRTSATSCGSKTGPRLPFRS